MYSFALNHPAAVILIVTFLSLSLSVRSTLLHFYLQIFLQKKILFLFAILSLRHCALIRLNVLAFEMFDSRCVASGNDTTIWQHNTQWKIEATIRSKLQSLQQPLGDTIPLTRVSFCHCRLYLYPEVPKPRMNSYRKNI